MSIERNIVFIYPLSKLLQDVKSTLEEDENFMIYEIDAIAEYGQLIGVMENSITFSSDLKKTEDYVNSSSSFIKSKNAMNLFFPTSTIPLHVLGKLKHNGINEYFKGDIESSDILNKISSFFDQREEEDTKKKEKEQRLNEKREKLKSLSGTIGGPKEEDGKLDQDHQKIKSMMSFETENNKAGNFVLKVDKNKFQFNNSSFDNLTRKNVKQFLPILKEMNLKKAKFTEVEKEFGGKIKEKENLFDAKELEKKKIDFELDEQGFKKKENKKFTEVEREQSKKNNKFEEVEREASKETKTFEEAEKDLAKKNSKFDQVVGELKKKKLDFEEQDGELNKKKVDVEFEETDFNKKKKEFEDVSGELKKKNVDFQETEVDLTKKNKQFTEEEELKRKKKVFDSVELSFEKKKGEIEKLENELKKKKLADVDFGDDLKKKNKDFENYLQELNKKKNNLDELGEEFKKKRKVLEEIDGDMNKKKLLEIEMLELVKKQNGIFKEIAAEKPIWEKEDKDESEESKVKKLDVEIEIEKNKKRPKIEELDIPWNQMHESELLEKLEKKKKDFAFEEISIEKKRKMMNFDFENHREFKRQEINIENNREEYEKILDYNDFKIKLKKGELKLTEEQIVQKTKELYEQELSEEEQTYYLPKSYGVEYLIVYQDLLLKEGVQNEHLIKFMQFALIKEYKCPLSLYIVDMKEIAAKNYKGAYRALFEGHLTDEEYFTAQEYIQFRDESYSSWHSISIPTFEDNTYQKFGNEFVYPYYENDVLIGVGVGHVPPLLNNHDDAKKIELLFMNLKGVVLNEKLQRKKAKA